MSWFNQHKLSLRIGQLVLLVIAIMGPWGYDRINVPAQYPCSPPFIRLEGDFCGSPLPGGLILAGTIGELIRAGVMLVSGQPVNSNLQRVFLVAFPALLLLLPFFSTLGLLIMGERRLQQTFQTLTWSMAAGLSLILVVTIRTGLLWAQWGIWFYVILAIGSLASEAVMMRQNRTLA